MGKIIPNDSPYVITTLDKVLGDTVGTPLSGAGQPINRQAKELQENIIAIDSAIGAASGIAELDENGQVPVEQLPNLVKTDIYLVADEAEMLALPVLPGDIAKRTDEDLMYILRESPASVLANWEEVIANRDALTLLGSVASDVPAPDTIPVARGDGTLDESWFNPNAVDIKPVKGLNITNNFLGDVDKELFITFIEALIFDIDTNLPFRVPGDDITLSLAISGTNGVDVLPVTNDSWYHIFLVSSGTGSDVYSMASLSPTDPDIFSAGYNKKTHIASVYVDGAGNFQTYKQFEFQAGTTLVNILSGGTETTPASADLVDYVPETARYVQGKMTIRPNPDGLGEGRVLLYDGLNEYFSQPVLLENSTLTRVSANFDIPIENISLWYDTAPNTKLDIEISGWKY